jgi:hypothetical protein
MKRVTAFTVCVLLAGFTELTITAQGGKPPDNATLLRQGFDEVSGWITTAAQAVPPPTSTRIGRPRTCGRSVS